MLTERFSPQKRRQMESKMKNDRHGKKGPEMLLPVSLEYGEEGQVLRFDLWRMPQMLVTGGAPDHQAAVVRKILDGWKTLPWIEPVIVNFPDRPAPGTETDPVGKLREMRKTLELRYRDLAGKGYKTAAEYLAGGHDDMPFHPVIILGFEKSAARPLPDEAVSLIHDLAIRGRAAGIDLVLCSTGAECPKGELVCDFPAKLVLHGGGEKDFSFSHM